jgi:predicted nucleic acid-binding protein
MSDEPSRQGLLDTNILILPKWISPAELPDEMAISAITLAELSAGPHEVRRNDDQSMYDESAERARRLEVLQRAESEFDPVPFDAEAARIYGRVTAAVIAAGRKPRGRAVDLMIAATAIAEGLPLYTTNPADFTGLHGLVQVIPVTRPPVPHEKTISRLSGAPVVPSLPQDSARDNARHGEGRTQSHIHAAYVNARNGGPGNAQTRLVRIR